MKASVPDHSGTFSKEWQGCLLLCACGLLVNILGVRLTGALQIPLYLDNIGTIVATVLGGLVPGILVGYISNLANSLTDPSTAYYASVTVLIAVAAHFCGKKKWFRFPWILIPILATALMGGGLGSIITWVLNGNTSLTGLENEFLAAIWLDLIDKAIVCTVSAVIIALIPAGLKPRLRLQGWRQTPLSREDYPSVFDLKLRSASLRTKIGVIVGTAIFLLAIGATLISGIMYHRTTIAEHTKLGRGIARLVASTIDPEQVEAYLESGGNSADYRKVEKQLYSIRDSSPDIEYVYVYQIQPDGCHVVFDLDTEEIPGSDPGEIVPFDESFSAYISDLLDGRPIEPLITNDTYGWLLTVYQPVYDKDGSCVCYAAADISMGQLTVYDVHFMIRITALFLGFFLFMLCFVLWLAEYNIILPINSMSMASGSFAYNSEEAREQSVSMLQGLKITTGDEIENLYGALVKTTGDTMQYISDVQDKNATITKMQNGLIMVLADMVESRDECTGDHVRKTAEYARVILEQMREEGLYPDVLTDEYIDDVVNSAPLHDVGKIQVPDALLNKPGRLTDEEFEKMKTHTTAGGDIISHAIALVSDTGYLKEAQYLATYHHERWDGRGYPAGLKGTDIPLSARVMAVADVFDALVSRRSYKPPFSFDKAMSIIEEEAGTHFDPDVANAFFHAKDKILEVSLRHYEE